ncbi:conserved protein [Tepidicaulis marinus]|uniref:Conserved protein n=1 Tax=Tepidicaulis marinus TaxID=1333998 RepID=A0A081BDT8_9HYPH|nr:hypothetical protein [Tepidicaulis marinus]GAK46206.1 conserved protein [Tepidicaulis marinus]
MAHRTRENMAWLPALLIAASAGLLSVLHAAPARDADTFGLFFAPGTGFAEAAAFVTEAGGGVLAPGRMSNIVIARFAEPGDVSQRLAQAPLWFAFSARNSGTCFSSSRSAAPTQPSALLATPGAVL